MAEELVQRNVVALSHAVRQDRTEARTLTPEQAKALLDAAQAERLHAAVVVTLTATPTLRHRWLRTPPSRS
jgi:hypothetical protein